MDLYRLITKYSLVNSVNVELANFKGLFKYIPIHCYDFDRESAPIQITSQIRLTGKISLAHTIGNITVYQTLIIHYTNFTNNAPQSSTNLSAKTAGEIVTTIATLARHYSYA